MLAASCVLLCIKSSIPLLPLLLPPALPFLAHLHRLLIGQSPAQLLQLMQCLHLAQRVHLALVLPLLF
jgi:hypothetical protein